MSKKYRTQLDYIADDVKELESNINFKVIADIHRVGSILDDRYKTKKDQNRPRLEILNKIIVNGGVMKATELANILYTSKQNITQRIDRLEKDGFVKRKSQSGDRRIKSIVITNKGIEFVRENLPNAWASLRAILLQVTDEELHTFIEILSKIKAELTE